MPLLKTLEQQYAYQYKVTNTEGNTIEIKTNLRFLNRIIRQMLNGYSPIICICGKQRQGKSFIGLWLSWLIMKSFSRILCMERNFVYDPMETLTKVNPLKQETFMLDEASSSFHRKEWFQRIHIAFDKIIITQGRKVVCYIFVSPFVADIDKSFVKHFDYIVEVEKRGYVKIFGIKKKYASLADKPFLRYFLDAVYIPMKTVPSDLWNEYNDYSNKEKDRIEKALLRYARPMKKDKALDDIKKILRRV